MMMMTVDWYALKLWTGTLLFRKCSTTEEFLSYIQQYIEMTMCKQHINTITYSQIRRINCVFCYRIIKIMVGKQYIINLKKKIN